MRKRWQSGRLETVFLCFFPSELHTFWHFPEVSFHSKCVKIRYSFFYNRKFNRVFCFFFSVKQPNICENKVKWSFEQFSNKSDEKMVREKICCLKLEFYNGDRKNKKNVIWRIFISLIMHASFMHFWQKVNKLQKSVMIVCFSLWAFKLSLK